MEELDKMFILYTILNKYNTKGVQVKTPHHVKEDQEEINRITSRLDKNEIVEIVARQSKHKPGGSAFTPATIFVTDKRIIIRKPTMLGAREKIDAINFDQITSIQLGKGVFSSTVKLMDIKRTLNQSRKIRLRK